MIDISFSYRIRFRGISFRHFMYSQKWCCKLFLEIKEGDFKQST